MHSANALLSAIELISPTNKGAFGLSDREKYLRRRSLYRVAGVNLLEVDALLSGEPLWPKSLSRMGEFCRHAWATTHSEGTRRFTGWGWNGDDSLPRLAWTIELEMRVLVDLEESFQQAAAFNNWPAIASPTG